MKRLIVNNKELKHVTNIEWADDLTTTANTINFDTDEQIIVGSQFALFEDNTLVMRGIISEYGQSQKNKFSYSGYDYGFYLNKNSIIKQFNGANVSQAIKSLCGDFSIPIGNIPALNATIKKIYKNNVLSDVIKELLELAQTKMNIDYYYMTCRLGKFEINKYELHDDLVGYLGDIYSIGSNKSIHNQSLTVSMEELKNQVVVVDNASDKIAKKVVVKDSNSIAKYGLLQHVEQVDTDNKNPFAKIGNNKLLELNKIKTNFSASMIGNHKMCKGVIIPIKNNDFDIEGDFLITSSKHTTLSNSEIVAVTLEKYDRNKIL